MVAALYADTLLGAVGNARVLEYRFAMWGDDEARALASALPLAERVEELDLFGNPDIGQQGLDALAAALRAGAAPRLRRFKMQSDWDQPKGRELRAACRERSIEVHIFGKDARRFVS